MTGFSSLDLRDVDVQATARDLRKVGETVAGSMTGHAANVAREAAYTVVGLGLLAYQRLQVRRREIEREMRRSA